MSPFVKAWFNDHDRAVCNAWAGLRSAAWTEDLCSAEKELVRLQGETRRQRPEEAKLMGDGAVSFAAVLMAEGLY